MWLARRPGTKGHVLAPKTQRQRLRTLRKFFERLIEWDWPDAPFRNPIIAGDIPTHPTAPQVPRRPHRRPAHGRRPGRDRPPRPARRRTPGPHWPPASELCDLDADAMIRIGDNDWLRIPLGKLHNDRYVPLHPDLVTLLAAWCADNLDHIRRHRRLIADHRGTIDRYLVGRIVTRVARQPASPACTPTNSGTPSPPKPSTAACGSRPSPPCSATARWR